MTGEGPLGKPPTHGGTVSPPRTFPLDPNTVRRTALDHATRFATGAIADVIAAAAAFEGFLLHGPEQAVNPDDQVRTYVEEYEMRDPGYTPNDREKTLIEDAIHGFIAEYWPKPGQPVEPPTPRNYHPIGSRVINSMFGDISFRRMLILNRIAKERLRQIQKGYDDVRDDAHDDGRIAYEAASAIMPQGVQLQHGFEPWISEENPLERLIQGLALGVAEVERITRALDAQGEAEAREAERQEEGE